MQLKKTLRDTIKVILDEVDNNPEFAKRLEIALGVGNMRRTTKWKNPKENTNRGNRRTPAVFDPVSIARESSDVLRARLSELDIEQLKDIVAEYGMDTAKLVMKWKSTERIIDRIVEVSVNRSKKGEAFL